MFLDLCSDIFVIELRKLKKNFLKIFLLVAIKDFKIKGPGKNLRDKKKVELSKFHLIKYIQYIPRIENEIIINITIDKFE